MALMSTSLGGTAASQLSPQLTQFSGLHKIFVKFENSTSDSNSTHCLFQNVDWHVRLASSRKGCSGVVAMAGSGKFFVGGNWKCNGTKDSLSKLISDLNSSALESDVGNEAIPPHVSFRE